MKTVGDKQYQVSDYSPPATYDGMGKDKPCYPNTFTPSKLKTSKPYEARGLGAGKKYGFSKNG